MLNRITSRLLRTPLYARFNPVRTLSSIVDNYKNTNIVWSELLAPAERQMLLDGAPRLRHKGACVWLTGLSGRCKTTVSAALEIELLKQGIRSYRIDGDNMRFGLNKDLGFSATDREENLRRIGEVASLYADAGLIAITAFISPYRASRDTARMTCEALGYDFVEVYVHCPLDVAESRDPKGLYVKARAGKINNFTGIDDPFEEPVNPEIRLDTHLQSVDKSVSDMISFLRSRGIIPIPPKFTFSRDMQQARLRWHEVQRHNIKSDNPSDKAHDWPPLL